MYARVKDSCRLPAVRACGGVMFVKGEWVDVPQEHESDALGHEMLEVKPATEKTEKTITIEQTTPVKRGRK